MLSDKPIYYTSTREHDGEKCESMYSKNLKLNRLSYHFNFLLSPNIFEKGILTRLVMDIAYRQILETLQITV